MRISALLNSETITCGLMSQDKEGVIAELAEPLAKISGMAVEELIRVLMDRERMGSTGIGSGIGIPHGKSKELSEPIMAFGLSRKGIDFESLDKKPAHIFFMLITPENAPNIHLKLLSGIAKILRNEPFRQRLMMAKTPDEVITILRDEEEVF
ncbi:MAG TPA: PTS fructose transporter subunit IIA [Desulfobacteraceae bacterium]|nr:PTS fructose transporter subunit IIA [Desulfobacteraceae bacterium]